MQPIDFRIFLIPLIGLPELSVTHSWPKLEYTRAVKLLLSKMSPKAKAAAKTRPKHIKGKYYHTIAGDQGADGVFGTAYGSRSRQNLTGRRTGNFAHVHQLSALYLARKPGLASVLDALRRYHLYCENNLHPSHVYGNGRQMPWLYVDGE